MKAQAVRVFLRSKGPLNPHSADSVTSDGGMLCVNQTEFPKAWHPVG